MTAETRPAAPHDRAPGPDAPPPRPRGASALWGSVPFALQAPRSAHGQVTAVSMMKDEGPYVLEWVAHHLAIGFTDLVVYTNDCSDGTDDMLIRLEELGLAHHRRNVIPEGLRPQPSALNHAGAEPVVSLSDWVMVFDADEFLSIRHGDGGLEGLLGDTVAKGANGIVITWRIFGSGGVQDWSPAPVTEQYLLAAPKDWNKGWGVKTLFRYDPEHWKLGIHRPKIRSKWLKTHFPDQVKWLNGSGREMEDYFKFRGWRSITRTVGYDQVQLNHYAVKSIDSYAIRKLRGNVNNKKDKYNSDYWALQDRNEERDETMLRYKTRRDALIGALLEDPVLAELHHRALARVEARLSELRTSPAYHELVAGLQAASQMPIGQISAKPPQARDPAKIAALMSEVEKARSASARTARKEAPREAVLPLPSGNYPQQPRAPGPEGPRGEWVLNHSLRLPLDPDLFSAPALGAIARGKFERGLARRLPQVLEENARLLSIGAGIGFIAAHLARLRPDLSQLIQEEDPALRAGLIQVFAQNEIAFRRGLRLEERSLSPADLPGYIAAESPDALALADGRISPADLAAILGAAAPAQLFLSGRLLEANRDRLAEYEAVLQAAGYLAVPGFDPSLTLFRIRKASPPDKPG